MGYVFIHDEREPKPQSGNIDRAGFHIHAVDGFADDPFFYFCPVQRQVEGHFGGEYFLQHPHRERPGADGRVADFQVIEQFFNTQRVKDDEVMAIFFVAPAAAPDQGVHGLVNGRLQRCSQFGGEVVSQVLHQALLTHILHNLFGRVKGPFLAVFFQQALENMPQHFGVDAHFIITGAVFVDGEIVLIEKLEQRPEVVGGQVDVGGEGLPIGPDVGIEQPAVQVRHPASGHSCHLKERVGPVGVVEGIEEQFGQALAVKLTGPRKLLE